MKILHLQSAQSILSGTMITFMLCVPVFAYAKENNSKENNGKSDKSEYVTSIKKTNGVSVTVPAQVTTKRASNKDERSEEKEDKKNSNCFRAFGHLIAPGWIKHNGTLNPSEECSLPVGIKNKFPTTTPPSTGTSTDTTAPIISNILVTPSGRMAVITWTTNEPSNSTVFYSTTSPVVVSASTTPSTSNNSFLRTRNHRVVLRNLTASTTYFFVVRSKDAAGNVATGNQMSFITATLPTDTTSPIISTIITTPATTTAKIQWQTNESSDSTVFFSTTLPVNVGTQATQLVYTNAKVTDHTTTLTGLTASTTYYAVIRSRDVTGNTTLSSTFSFVTGTTTDITPPSITNVFALISTSTIKFTWTTDEPATTKVFYSTTTPVNTSASTTPFVENITLVNTHTMTISGLTPNIGYNFVVQSKDAATNGTTLAEFAITTNQ
jgi:hypothetical protein